MTHMAENVPYVSSEGVLDSLKKKVHKLSYLHEISHKINTMQDSNELLEYVLSTALNSLSSQAGSIFLWDDHSEQLCLKHVIGRDRKKLEGITQRLGEGVSGLVAKEKRPVLVKNIKTDPRFNVDEKEGYKSNSFLCVPMIARNKLVGVVNITEKDSSAPFNFDELEFLFILSNHVAIAIDNLSLYEKVTGFNAHLEEKVKDATQKLEKIVEHSLILQHYKEDILESLATGIYVLDRGNRITLWNRGMELKYGLKREEVLGKHFYEVLRHIKPENLIKAIQEVHDTGSHLSLDGVRHKINGSNEESVINYKIFPLQTESPEHRGVVVLLDDVTEKIKMEEALRTNERLAAIGKLSSGIAHELNNPLDGTQRYLNLSLDAIERGDMSLPREFIMNAKEGVSRMIRIVRSLLEFSRQTTVGVPSSADVRDVLSDVVSYYTSDPHSQGVAIRFDCSGELLPVVDFGVQNVFSNLLKNAIDAMNGAGSLQITAEMLNDGRKKNVKVVISDTGPGMPEDVQRRIFEPFFTTKKMGSGTGLGLSICQEIVHRCGGEIFVSSELERGTAFTVILPTVQ